MLFIELVPLMVLAAVRVGMEGVCGVLGVDGREELILAEGGGVALGVLFGGIRRRRFGLLVFSTSGVDVSATGAPAVGMTVVDISSVGERVSASGGDDDILRLLVAVVPSPSCVGEHFRSLDLAVVILAIAYSALRSVRCGRW